MNLAWSLGGSLLTAALMLPSLAPTHGAAAPAPAPAGHTDHCTHGACPDSPAPFVSPRRGPGGGRGFTPMHERLPCPTCHRPWPGGPGWSGPLPGTCGCTRAPDGADARPLHPHPGAPRAHGSRAPHDAPATPTRPSAPAHPPRHGLTPAPPCHDPRHGPSRAPPPTSPRPAPPRRRVV